MLRDRYRTHQHHHRNNQRRDARTHALRAPPGRVGQPSVSETDGQVVAIALHRVGGPITLTVAKNEEVPGAVITYLRGLVRMATEYSKLSPTNEEGRRDKQLEIMKAMYIHCDQNISQRFTKRKWLPLLEKALNARAVEFGGLRRRVWRSYRLCSGSRKHSTTSTAGKK